MDQTNFYPRKIEKWNGRYGRIEGQDYAFHIKWNNELKKWWICTIKNTQDNRVSCWADYSEQLNKLVEAVNKGKQFFVQDHKYGGSFMINEFGQVIVPASDGSRKRAIVGEVRGKILFRDVLTNELIDLSESSNIKLGDRWNKPYIGMTYHLSKSNRIYFWHNMQDGGRSEYLTKSYDELINKIRALKKYGSARFLVNPYGIVLTKISKYSSHEGELMDNVIFEEWIPVFVCKINYKYWFAKER